MSDLWQARFFKTVSKINELPKHHVPEIAFAGRSNAGKSSVINILCNQKKLAFSSKIPGRTQNLNFFSIGGALVSQHKNDLPNHDEIKAFLVDMPGYGYTRIPISARKHWEKFLGDYVNLRHQLRALILIVDSRHSFTNLDLKMLNWFAGTGKPVHCLLNKSDKLKLNQSKIALNSAEVLIKSFVKKNGSKLPFSVQLFSTITREGLFNANKIISNFLRE